MPASAPSAAPARRCRDLYALPPSDFHDITSGGSTSTSSPPGPNYSAGPGYDLVTGRGSPIANLVVGGLIGGVQIQVFNGASQVADGGSVSMTATVGSTATDTFTIKNLGAKTLTLSDPITLPAGFTLTADFGTTSVAQGASTTFTVQLNTSVITAYSGTVSFGTNDPNNNPFTFTLTATVGSTQIIDDSSASGFSTTAGWTYYGGQGYLNEVHYAAAGNGSQIATWTFTAAPGSYDVAVTYSAQGNRATNAPYTIYDGNIALGTVSVNQQSTPNDFIDQGVGWKDLGTFTITGNTLVVKLTNAANNYVIADAVRIQQVAPQAQATLSDNGTKIANGGSDAFGTTATGTPVTKTFTVKNTGTANLTLSSLSVPAGYTIASNFGSTTVTPGSSTTFAVQLTAAVNGTYNGSISFTTNGPSNTTYTFTVSGTVTTPQATAALFDAGTSIANGGSDSFGTTTPGVPATKTFTVKNTGTANLTLSALSVPAGYTIASNFASTTVVPGSSTTFAVQLTAASTGTYSGTVSFTTNDPNTTTYSFAVSGTVAVVPTTQIIDDSNPSGFTVTSGWISYGGQGYLNGVHYAAAGNGSQVATWTFTVATRRVRRGRHLFGPKQPRHQRAVHRLRRHHVAGHHRRQPASGAQRFHQPGRRLEGSRHLHHQRQHPGSETHQRRQQLRHRRCCPHTEGRLTSEGKKRARARTGLRADTATRCQPVALFVGEPTSRRAALVGKMNLHYTVRLPGVPGGQCPPGQPGKSVPRAQLNKGECRW